MLTESIMGKCNNSIYRIPTYFNIGKSHLFLVEVAQCINNGYPQDMMSYWGSLLVSAVERLGTHHEPDNPWWGNILLLIPCMVFLLKPMTTLCMDFLSKHEVAGNGDWHIYRICTLSSWLLRASSGMDVL